MRRLKAIFACTLDAILLADDEGRYLDANPAACRMLGYSCDELLGLTIEDIVVGREEGRTLWREFLERGVREGEIDLRRKDGTLIRTAYRAVANVEPGVHLSVMRDVSERIATEEQLRASRRRFQRFSDHLPGLAYLKDAEGRYEFASAGFGSTLGVAPARLVGRTDEEIWPAETAALFRAHDERVLSSGRPAIFDETVTVGGELRHFISSKFPVEVDDRVHLGGITIEVTERVRAQRELAAGEERFRSAFEEAPIGAVLLSPELTIRRGNRAFLELSGYTQEELAGRDAASLTVSEDVDPAVGERLRRGGTAQGLVRRYRRKDGGVFWGRVSATAIGVEEGRPREVLAMVEDISELVRAAEERERLLAELRRLTSALSAAEDAERAALARELHDAVGQELAALSLNLGVLRKQVPEGAPGTVEQLIRDSMEIVEEVGTRVRDVMAELRPPVLDAYGLLATLRWSAQRVAERTPVTIRVRGVEPAPRLGPLAEMALVRVAQEALRNAVRHAEASNVWLTLHAGPELVRLTVTDDGIGFDAQALSPAANGGWGVVGMRERMEVLGGTLRIESEAGRGTRVVAELSR